MKKLALFIIDTSLDMKTYFSLIENSFSTSSFEEKIDEWDFYITTRTRRGSSVIMNPQSFSQRKQIALLPYGEDITLEGVVDTIKVMEREVISYDYLKLVIITDSVTEDLNGINRFIVKEKIDLSVLSFKEVPLLKKEQWFVFIKDTNNISNYVINNLTIKKDNTIKRSFMMFCITTTVSVMLSIGIHISISNHNDYKVLDTHINNITNNILIQNNTFIAIWLRDKGADTVKITVDVPTITESEDSVALSNSIKLDYKIDDYRLGEWRVARAKSTWNALRTANQIIEGHLNQFSQIATLELTIIGEADAFTFKESKIYDGDNINGSIYMYNDKPKSLILAEGDSYTTNEVLAFLRVKDIHNFFNHHSVGQDYKPTYIHEVKTNDGTNNKGGKYRGVEIGIKINGLLRD